MSLPKTMAGEPKQTTRLNTDLHIADRPEPNEFVIHSGRQRLFSPSHFPATMRTVET
jgi:hypothetical protein